MSIEEQNQTWRDAKALQRQSETNLAAVKLKLQMAARDFGLAANAIRKALEADSAAAVLLPDRLASIPGIMNLFEEWQREANQIRSMEAQLRQFQP